MRPQGLQQARLPCPSLSWSLLKFMSLESVMPTNHLTLCCSLLLLPSIFPSIRVFFNESVLHIRWPKFWSFSLNISPSSEYSGLISFRMDWLILHAVQGTLESLLQHYSSKALILWCSAFFTVQLSVELYIICFFPMFSALIVIIRAPEVFWALLCTRNWAKHFTGSVRSKLITWQNKYKEWKYNENRCLY